MSKNIRIIPRLDIKGPNVVKVVHLERVRSEDYFYFVHSYVVVSDDADAVLATTCYGNAHFHTVIKQGDMYGCQFHPEKSGKAGLLILDNFLKLGY